MGKYNYASAETIINMIRENTLKVVTDIVLCDREPEDIAFVHGVVRLANVLIAEMQREDDDQE